MAVSPERGSLGTFADTGDGFFSPWFLKLWVSFPVLLLLNVDLRRIISPLGEFVERRRKEGRRRRGEEKSRRALGTHSSIHRLKLTSRFFLPLPLLPSSLPLYLSPHPTTQNHLFQRMPPSSFPTPRLDKLPSELLLFATLDSSSLSEMPSLVPIVVGN